MKEKKIDWIITLVPLAIIVALCILFFALPEQSNAILSQVRFFFGDTFGIYYLIIGLGIFLISIFIAGSKYGDIVLGEPDEKPKYSFFSWGCMMFTCGLAADILFYSFSEWIMYATNPHIKELGSIQEWELYSLGILSCFSCSIWFYASCKEKKPSEIFGSMQTCSWKTHRWFCRTYYRPVSCICTFSRNSNHI